MTITCAFCSQTGEQGGWYRTHPLCTSCTDGLREVDDFEGRRLVRPVTGDCEDDCQEQCVHPGEFAECEVST